MKLPFDLIFSEQIFSLHILFDLPKKLLLSGVNQPLPYRCFEFNPNGLHQSISTGHLLTQAFN